MTPRHGFCARAGLLALAAVGCGSSYEVPHGAPVLLRVYWTVPRQGNLVVWSNDPAAPLAGSVPAAPTQFSLVFDRVIDGSKVEDTVTVTGGTRQQPKADPPLTVDWPGKEAAVSVPPFALAVWYNSLPFTGEANTTAYVYGRELPCYPAGTTVTITVPDGALAGKYGDPITGIPPIPVATQPFAVTINPPTPASVPVNYWLPLQFNSRPADPTTVLPAHVHATIAGADVPFQLVAEPLDATLIYLQPAAGAIWPSGSTVEVTVDGDLPDAFGAGLGVSQIFTFMPCVPLDTGSGCAPPSGPGPAADAGAGDAVTPTDAAVAAD